MKAIIYKAFGGVALVFGLAACSQLSGPGVNQAPAYDEAQYNLDVEALKVKRPSRRSPLQMTASLIPATASPGETVRVVIKVRLKPLWHCYDYVPEGEPFKQTERLMELGEGLQASGDWQIPESTPYIKNPSLMVYQGGREPLVFYRDLVVADDASGELTVKTGLKYQVCDENMCLPPKKNLQDLVLTVVN